MIRRGLRLVARPLVWCIRQRIASLDRQLWDLLDDRPHPYAYRAPLDASHLRDVRGWELLRDVEDQPEPSPAYLLVAARDEALRALLALDRRYAERWDLLALGEPPERALEVEHATW